MNFVALHAALVLAYVIGIERGYAAWVWGIFGVLGGRRLLDQMACGAQDFWIPAAAGMTAREID